VSLFPFPSPLQISKHGHLPQNILLLNVAGTTQSPARTTHPRSRRGISGPPCLTLPNPVDDYAWQVSPGCLTWPLTTGLNSPNRRDAEIGFKVAQIEVDPAGFFADNYNDLFPLGVVREQLA